MQFRLTKSRRKRGLRVYLQVPWSWCREPSDEMIDFIQDGDGNEKVFQNFTAGRVNSFLKHIQKRTNQKGKHFTSYAFRRRFMNDIMSRFPDEVEKRARFSLHLNSLTTVAYYKAYHKLGSRKKREKAEATTAAREKEGGGITYPEEAST